MLVKLSFGSIWETKKVMETILQLNCKDAHPKEYFFEDLFNFQFDELANILQLCNAACKD